MEAKIQRLKQIYAAFVDRPVDGALVIATDDMSTFVIVHTVKEFDDRSNEDVQFSVVAPFESPSQLASTLVAQLERERVALAAQDGPAPALTAPLPPECFDDHVAPIRRIESLIQEVHRRVVDPERRVTWCLCPVEIRDPRSYADVVAGLLLMPRPRGLRLVIRDLRDHPCLDQELVRARDESIITTPFSISVDEIKEDTARKAADPRLPMSIRLPSLLQIAIDDLSAGHVDAAERKYALIATCAEPGQEATSAIAWHGLGQIAERRGDLTAARSYHERALGGLKEVKALPLRYAVVSSLGRAAAALGDHRAAEDCFVCASALGVAMGVRSVSAEALERLGEARLSQRKIAGARDAWVAATDLLLEDGDVGRGHDLRQRADALIAAHPMEASLGHGHPGL